MADKTLVILISGRGSNMEALLAAQLPARVAAVISNNPQARGLGIARDRGSCDRRGGPSRVCRPRRVRRGAGGGNRPPPARSRRARGLHAHTHAVIHRALPRAHHEHPSFPAAGVSGPAHAPAGARGRRAHPRLHGALRHPDLDSGPVIVQAAVPVQPGDTEEQLAARVLAQEHRIYPQAVRWFCEGRLQARPQRRGHGGRRARGGRRPDRTAARSALRAPER